MFSTFANPWDFTHQMSSPRYSQRNGKVEATVKSMKKLLAASWNHCHLNNDKLCRTLQYRNTLSLPAHRRSFSPEWQCSTQEVDQQAAHRLRQSETYYNTHTRSLADLEIGSTVALQNTQTRHWDIYGRIVDIGPNRRYYIRTRSRRVLVRNQCFLRHHTPASCVPFTTRQINPSRSPQPPPASQLPVQEVPQPPQLPRRSQRPHRAPVHLIEDPSWV